MQHASETNNKTVSAFPNQAVTNRGLVLSDMDVSGLNEAF
jgi:hypothetical protein